MIFLLWRSLVGKWAGEKTLTLLAVLGAALGVASVVSVQMINENALAAFRASTNVVSGEADLVVVPRDGLLADQNFSKVLGTPGVSSAFPVVNGTVALREKPDSYIDVVGVDVFAPSALSDSASMTPTTIDALASSNWAAFPKERLEREGWRVGDEIAVSFGSRVHRLKIGASIDLRAKYPQASPGLAFMDIAAAQQIFGPGLSGIGIRLARGATAEAVSAQIRSRVANADVQTPGQRVANAERLLAAFRLNLTAMSLISVFVGFFLVLSSMTAALIRRRSEFGVMLSIGAKRGQVIALILIEAALLGAAGVALGVPLGALAAKANVASVSATLSNVYLLSEIGRVELPPFVMLLGACVGVFGAVAAAVAPALDIARRSPSDLLSIFSWHDKFRSSSRFWFAAGAAALVAAGTWYAVVGRSSTAGGFVLSVAVLFFLSCATPRVLEIVCGRAPVEKLGLGMSFRGLSARIGTVALSTAALAIAVSMMLGVTGMISSFRDTVRQWIGDILISDIYVTTPSFRRARGAAALDSAAIERFQQSPDVIGVERLRQIKVRVNGREIALSGVDFGEKYHGRFSLLSGDPQAVQQQVREGAVLIGEPLSRKEGLGAGDLVALDGPGATPSLLIAGVYFDYGAENGSAMMDLGRMTKIFGDGPINSVALTLAPGKDPEEVVASFRAAMPDSALEIRSNRRLRAEVLRIFDQTFAVTRLLQFFALLIAAAGVALALFVFARERLPEWALLRALGAEPGQVFRLFLGQGAAIALTGIGIGVVGGISLMALLIFVINRKTFGWTIQWHWPLRESALQIVSIVAVTLAASLLPSLRASKNFRQGIES